MPITPELLDQILKDYQKPEDLIGDLAAAVRAADND